MQTGLGEVKSSDVNVQLERLLSSQELAGSDQLKRLLRLVVERSLNGQADLVKEYNLGLEVFQRPPDYDPKLDPIVRVQARRLRAKLEEYYAGEGASDEIIIRIPKGAYVPVFETRAAPVAEPNSASISVAAPFWRRKKLVLGLAVLGAAAVLASLALHRTGAPILVKADQSVAVLPLKLFSKDTSRSYVADQATEVLTTELARSGRLSVVSRTTSSRYGASDASLPEIARALGVRWVVEGGVGMEGERAYVKLRAVDAWSDRKLWADVYDFEPNELLPAHRRAADDIVKAIEARLSDPAK